MLPSSRTPEGQPRSCPVCRTDFAMEPSWPAGDAPCPHCGQLLWFPNPADAGGLDFLVGNGVVHELQATSVPEVVAALVELLGNSRHIRPEDAPSITQAILRREELGSTGIGRGYAFPHTKHEAVDKVVGIMGHVPAGIDFNSLDGKPVNRIFLLVSPHDCPDQHLRALERLSRAVRNTSQ